MTGWQMKDDDGNFDEPICEELALELVDQQEPVKPSTKDKHLLPPTVPCRLNNFIWRKKKGVQAVRAFFKERQYLTDMGVEARNKNIAGLFQHARNRGRNKIFKAWCEPVVVATRADLHAKLSDNENCGELVLSQDARVEADVLTASLPHGFPTYSFAAGAGYTDEEGKPCSKKAWSKQSQTSEYMRLFNLAAADFKPSQAEASQNALKSIKDTITKQHGDRFVVLGKPEISSVYDGDASALSAFRYEKYCIEAAHQAPQLHIKQHMSNGVGSISLPERIEVQIRDDKFSASCTQIFLKSSQIGIPLAYDGELVNYNENHCNDPPVFRECDFCYAAAAWQAATPYILKPMWRICTSPLCASKQLAIM